MKKLLLFGTLIIGSNLSAQTPGGGVIDIDGNNYTTVIIGNQEWMAENLRTASYSNGDPIPNVTSDTQWPSLTTGAWAYYNNDSLFENPYGKLYNWYTVYDSRNICPTGWHVPLFAEWNVLSNEYLGGAPIAGGKMKSIGTQNWQAPNTDATNESGFSGLPGGLRSTNGGFYGIGAEGRWWENDTSGTSCRILMYQYGSLFVDYVEENRGFSVRCMRESSVSGVGIIKLKNESKKLIKIVDLLGRETEFKPNTPLIFIYNDGTRERMMKIEE